MVMYKIDMRGGGGGVKNRILGETPSSSAHVIQIYVSLLLEGEGAKGGNKGNS